MCSVWKWQLCLFLLLCEGFITHLLIPWLMSDILMLLTKDRLMCLLERLMSRLSLPPFFALYTMVHIGCPKGCLM